MKPRLWTLFATGLIFILGTAVTSTAPASPQDAENVPGVIRSESQLVLVDVIATDKKGRHLSDLESKDFRIFEDNKEQPITSFSHMVESADTPAEANRRYILLFFDNSTMNSADQQMARKAAGQFVLKTASENRLMAVIDFGGLSHVAQDFTSDSAALQAAVSNVKFSSLRSTELNQPTEVASVGAPSMSRVRSDFAARSMLLALRNACLNLRGIKGRKTLILFSSGFPLSSERETELAATLDSANKANVAIYPVDVRGLSGISAPDITSPSMRNILRPGGPGAILIHPQTTDEPVLVASLAGGIELQLHFAQRPGGGTGGSSGGGSGGTGGGGASGGGGRPGTGGSGGIGGGGGTRGGSPTGGNPSGGSRGGFSNNPNNMFNNGLQNNSPMTGIIPQLMENVTSAQQVLYALADGTGGFVIANTNDFASGLDKIAQDIDDYYIIGYVPPNPAHDGSYHKIKVKIERHGVEIRARNGYFDAKSKDMLAGKPEGKTLEQKVEGSQPGDFPVTVAAPFFYTSPGVARVNLAIQIPPGSVGFEKMKGKFHSEVNVLGIAYAKDGSVAARFSDTVKNDVEKKEMKQLEKEPFRYRNNFDIAPGNYDLKIALSGEGQKFGKVEIPLKISPFVGNQFAVSDLALSKEVRPASELASSLGSALFEERTLLVFNGMEFVPTSEHSFPVQSKFAVYCEVYEPEPIANGFPKVGVIVDIFDKKTNERKFTTNTVLINQYATEGNPVIPVGLQVPASTLQAGDYLLKLQARDSLGHASVLRTMEFTLK